MNEEHTISRTNGIDTETYDQTYGRGLNITGDFIYYLGFGEKKGLFRMNKNSPKDIQQIHETYTNDLNIVDDYLFYSLFSSEDQTKNGIYRAELDGKNEQQLVKGMINYLQWSDGWIYYAIPTNGKVLKVSPNGKQISEIKTKDGVNISTTNFLVFDDWIYFENENELFDSRNRMKNPDGLNIYRMQLDGSNLEALAKGSINLYVEEGPYIFYTTPNENRLFRMDVDGSNKTEVYYGEKEWSWINHIGDDLYLLDWNSDETAVLYQTNIYGSDLKNFLE